MKRLALRGKPNDKVKLRYDGRLVTVALDARGRAQRDGSLA